MPDAEREALILEYAHLVRYVVGRIMVELPAHVDRDDLVSHGTIGLIKAVDRFDASRGVKFETYAIAVIRGAVLEALRQDDWVPRSVREKARRVQDAVGRLEAELGRPPEVGEIADALEISMDDYERLLSEISVVTLTSLEGALNAEGDSAVRPMDVETEHSQDPDRAYEVEERKTMLRTAVDLLPEREKLVVALYYQEGLTLKEIGRVLDVTESRVCQIHTQALLRLRSRLSFRRDGILGAGSA
jgi:RNA polymerase sigma factor for flagellar operon FliA